MTTLKKAAILVREIAEYRLRDMRERETDAFW
jgi:hypothetical protein